MAIKTVYLKNRTQWRLWLEKHSSSKKEVWLLYYKRASGKERVEYADAVEEALCFGWIDGKIKRIDENCFAQRFSPRKPGSRWSQLNVTRAKKMIAAGKMREAGMSVFDPATVVAKEPLPTMLPAELERKFRAADQAWQKFTAFPPSYQRMTIGWVASAKKPETQAKRLQQLMEFSAKNKKIKFM